jgi:multidrug efflux pump subunit AcrB
MIRLGDIARVTRGPADPAQPMFRANGREAIGLAIAMRKGGDILALGHNVARAMTEITANLPVGIEPTLVADQPVTVEHAVDEFMEALWEAVATFSRSFDQPGPRARLWPPPNPPSPAFATMLCSASFRDPLGPSSLLSGAFDDAMITIESMVTRLERGDDKEQAATFAYTSTAFPRLTGTLVTIAGFVPIGFARSAAGEMTFSISPSSPSLIASWIVAALFAPLLWRLDVEAKVVHLGSRPDRQRVPARAGAGDAARWVTVLVTLGLFEPRCMACASSPAVLSCIGSN